jgi:hypothetical protein
LRIADLKFKRGELYAKYATHQRSAFGKLKFDIQKTFAPCSAHRAALGCF